MIMCFPLATFSCSGEGVEQEIRWGFYRGMIEGESGKDFEGVKKDVIITVLDDGI